MTDAMVNGTAQAILRAHHSLAPIDLRLGTSRVRNASVNRSPTAYLLNPADERAKYEEAGGDADETIVQLTARLNGTNNITGVLNCVH